MQKLSDKSRDSLYEAVSEEVMLARIKIEKLNIQDVYVKEQIYKIMFGLSCSAPQKALDCFVYNKER